MLWNRGLDLSLGWKFGRILVQRIVGTCPFYWLLLGSRFGTSTLSHFSSLECKWPYASDLCEVGGGFIVKKSNVARNDVLQVDDRGENVSATSLAGKKATTQNFVSEVIIVSQASRALEKMNVPVIKFGIYAL